MVQLQDATTSLKQTNAGTLIAQAQSDPATQGRWDIWSNKSPILPVHAVLLPPDSTGKSNVLFFSGSGNSLGQIPDGGVVVDYINQNFSGVIAAPVDANNDPLDLFCAGQSLLPNGNVMVVGGTLYYNGIISSNFDGLRDAFIFDRNTRQWIIVQPMGAGRWYPTQVTLGDGRVLAVSGFTERGELNTLPEIYSATNNSWTAFQSTSPFAIYAHLFLLQDGRVFYSGAYFSINYSVYPRILNLSTNPFTETPLSGGLQEPDSGNQAASVLLPPAQEQRVMIMGGGNSADKATSRVNVVDLKANNPTYTPATYLNNPRMHLSAVLLPDRTVLVCNGSKMSEKTDAANTAIPAEIYDPATNIWTQVATANVQTRVYHSVALLLPDGRVITAGGNPVRLNECLNTNSMEYCTNGDNPGFSEELRIEMYSPPYLFKGTRPVIGSAPQTVSYGQTITIQTAQARNIQWVHLIRPMATTHSLDTEQRLVDLPITSRTDTALNVTVTDNPNLAPPGWYMLFITTDTNKIPSVASWVQLTAVTTTPPTTGANLIQDGSFENQTSTTLSGPWYHSASGNGGVDYNAGKARTGNNNGWIDNNTNTWSAIN